MAALQAAAPPGMRAGTCAAGWSSLPSPSSSSCASSSSSLQGRRLVLGVSGDSGRGRQGREGFQPLQVRASEDVPFLKKLGTQIVRPKSNPSEKRKAKTKRGRARSPQGREEEESEDFSLDNLLKKISLPKPSPTLGPTKGTLVLRETLTAPVEFNFGRVRRSESRTIFVAGALGQIGARTAQKLLKSGFVVRAGVPDLRGAQQLAEFATQYGILTTEEARRLNAVEFDFKDGESVAKALGNAGKVLVTVGPTEDGPKGEVTADDALRVVEAAALANVGHFILVAEPVDGRAKQDGGFFATILNFLKPKQGKLSLEELIDKIAATDLKYTVIKAASTASVDEFGVGNIDFLEEGSSKAATAKVGKLQVAAAIDSAFTNSTVSENKVIVVVSSPFAEEKTLEDLFSAIPRDNRRQLVAEALIKAEAEENEKQERLQAEAEARAAAEAAREAVQTATRLEAEARKLAQEEARASALAAKAQARAAAAAATLEDVSGKVKGLGGTVSGSSKEAGFIKDLSFLKGSGKEGASSPAEPKDLKQIFGTFFKQETVFVDE